MKANEKLIAISSGNSKIGRGIYNISTLPGDKNHLIAKKDGTVLSTVPGTCNGMCATCYNYCYAVPAAKRYPTVLKAWEKNTLMQRNHKDKYYSLIKDFLLSKKTVKDFRWNVAGEIETYEDLIKMNALALEVNVTKNGAPIWYGVYTKQYGFILRFLKEFGSFAPNFVVNVSAWHNLVELMKLFADYKNEINIFAYDDGNAPQTAVYSH